MTVTRHCRTRQRLAQGRHPQHRHRRRAVRRRRARAGRRPQRRRRPPRPPRRSPASPRCCMPTASTSPHGLAENVAAQVLAHRRRTTATSCSRPPRSGKNIAPRVAAKLDVGADLRHHQGRSAPTPSSARSTPATRSPPCRASTRSRSSPCAPPASIRRRRPAAAPRSRPSTAVADSGKSSFVGSEIAKSDRPELTAAKIIVSGGRALGSSREVQRSADAAGRQARRRARRQPRRGRRRLRAERLAGRPDRQDRRAAAVHRRAASPAPSSTWPA